MVGDHFCSPAMLPKATFRKMYAAHAGVVWEDPGLALAFTFAEVNDSGLGILLMWGTQDSAGMSLQHVWAGLDLQEAKATAKELCDVRLHEKYLKEPKP